MASDRRRGFEAWARTHGDPAVRAHERRAIAEDLFEVARDRDVRPEHVEELTRRYRERFAGAQRILLTQQIAEEIFAFQVEPRPTPPRAPDARREDDEVIGIALDPISSAGVEVAPPPAIPRTATPLPSLDLAPAPAVPAAPTSSPDRPRTGAAGWAAPQRGTTGGRPPTGPRAEDGAEPAAEQGLWAPLRDATPGRAGFAPAPAPSAPDLLEPPAATSPALEMASPGAPPPPRRVSSRPPPPAAALGRLEVAGLSSRPPPPAAAPPPVASPAAPGLPASISPASSSAAGPLGLDRAKLASIGAAAAGVLFLIGLVVARPSCIFPGPTAEVRGRHASEHLGVALTFPEPWMHEGRRDDDDRRGDWDRASSVFFQGVSVDEFAIQLTVVTLTSGGRPPTEDDLRSVGAAELAGVVDGRQCGPYDRYGTKAVRCTGLQTRGDRRFAMLEEYFTTGSRIVYARGLVETVSPAAAAEPPPAPTAPLRPRGGAEPSSPLSDLDARRLEAILDSVESLPP